VQVLCGQCGQSIVVEDAQAGSLVACPRCQNQVQVPRLDEVEAVLNGDDSTLGLGDSDEGFAGMAKQAMSRKIQVACGKCGRTLTVSARMAGRKARCPACNTQILIPYPDEGQDDAALERLTKRNHRPHNEPPPQPHEHHAQPASDAQAMSQDDQEPVAAVPVKSDSLETLVAAAAALDSAANQQSVAQDVPADLAEAVADVAAERRTRISRKMRGWMFYVALGCAAGIAIGLGIYLVLALLAPPPPGTTEVAHVPPDPSPQTGPAPHPAPTTKKGAPTQPVIPPPATPKISVVTAELKDFGAGGYFPARPGHVFWEVTAALKAGDKPLSFYNYGKTATLTTASGTYESLGSPPDSPALPVPSRREVVSLAGSQGRQISLLFQVPISDKQGTLKVASLPEAPVQPAPVQAPTSLAGTYPEASPRNLRPLLRDPVMAAIQAAPAHQIVLKDAQASGLEVSIPAAAVSGSAQAGPDGMYQAVLRNGKDELKCALRPMVDGRGVILYLSDQPFHQLTYARPGRPKPQPRPQPPKPKPPATTSGKAQPAPPVQTQPQTAPTGPGTLFDDPNTAGRPASRPAGESHLPVLPPKDPPPTPTLPRDHGHRTIFDH